jgi:dihydrodipicolinate synthase/N-acetylneuraminate lyase
MSQAIAARILGLKVHWGHDAYFAYCDRWAYEDDAPNGAAIIAAYQDYNAAAKAAGGPGVTPVGGSYINEFAKEMYTTYRAKYD